MILTLPPVQTSPSLPPRKPATSDAPPVDKMLRREGRPLVRPTVKLQEPLR